MNLWKCFWANWFWPVLALLLLGLLEMWPGGKWRGIEGDVASRVESALTQSGAEGIEVITHDRGRDVLLKGSVSSEDEKNGLIDLARNVTDESGNIVANDVEWAGTVNEPKPEPIVLTDPKLAADITDGKITLNGVLSNRSQVDAVVASAYAKFGADNVTNNLTVGENIKPLNGLSGLFGNLDLSNGSLAIDGNTVNLSGQVESDDIKSQIGSSVSSLLGSGFSVNNGLSVVTSELEAPKENLVCQTQLVDLMNDSQIFFKTSSAVIKAESYPLLDSIVSVLNQCSDANVSVEVAGHTDSTGTEKINLPLSQQRAESVVSYVVGKGVAQSTLTAKGYGSSTPVASNGTSEGRAQNRRIEFTIK